jgi:malate dehydrogenase
VTADDVKNVIIWGNHSSTQYPDVNHAKVKLHGKEVGVYEALKDDSWLKGEFIMVRKANELLRAKTLESHHTADLSVSQRMKGKPQGQQVFHNCSEDCIFSFLMIQSQS